MSDEQGHVKTVGDTVHVNKRRMFMARGWLNTRQNSTNLRQSIRATELLEGTGTYTLTV